MCTYLYCICIYTVHILHMCRSRNIAFCLCVHSCVRSEKTHLFVHTKLFQIKRFMGSTSSAGNPTNSSAGWIKPIFHGKHIFARFMFHWYVMLAYRKLQFVHLEKLESVPPFEKKCHFLLNLCLVWPFQVPKIVWTNCFWVKPFGNFKLGEHIQSTLRAQNRFWNKTLSKVQPK